MLSEQQMGALNEWMGHSPLCSNSSTHLVNCPGWQGQMQNSKLWYFPHGTWERGLRTVKFTVRVLWLFIGPLPSSLVQVVLSSYCMSHTILSSRNRAVWNQIKDVSFIKEKHFKKKQQLLLKKKRRKAQETQNSQNSLEKRNKVGGLLSLKIYYKGTLVKPV